MPTWRTAINPDEWGTLPNSQLSTSGVMESGAGSVISAWGGGFLNTKGVYNGSTFIAGTFLCVWGGGHGDYSGNEMYAYGPLENDSPTWLKLRNPTSPAPDSVAEDGSGNPVSRHTYSAINYIGSGSRNWMVSMGVADRYSDAGGSVVSHKFDFDTASPNTNNPWSKVADAADSPNKDTAFDSALNRVWYRPGTANSVGYYDVAANTHSSGLFKSPPWSGSTACDVDTALGIWAIRSSDVAICFYRTNNGTGNDYYTPSTTGTAPSTANLGLAYDPLLGRFACRDTGKSIFYLTPPATSPYQGGNAWTWSSETPSGGSTPSAGTTNGTYGRFRYVGGSLRGYILLNSATESIYYFRASDPPPPPPPPRIVTPVRSITFAR
jgi:hypothetical protein